MVNGSVLMVACLFICLPALVPRAGGAEPAALPDLSVRPDDVGFSILGEVLTSAYQEYDYITIGVIARNAGPGASTGANVTFSDNGLFLALVPIGGNLSGSAPGNETGVTFNWYIADTETGNHTIRVEVSDPAGDADPVDNSAEVKIRVYGRAPVIAVRFDTAAKHAAPSATSPAVLTMTGSIITDHPPGPVGISLQASINNGWACSLNVSSLVITDFSPHDFCVTVTIPPGTRTDDFGNLRATAMATADGLTSMAQTHGMIIIDPYFDLTASLARNVVAIGPGGSAFFELTVRNRGNSVDGFSIVAVNAAELERTGWTVKLSSGQASRVNPGDSRLLVLELQPPKDWAPYKDETARIGIRVASLNSDDFGEQAGITLNLTVVQKGFNQTSAGMIFLVILLAALVSAVAVYLVRRRPRRKTVADYNRELHLDG